MSVVFLGTSNCVLNHSAVFKVREIIGEPVVNASIGASGSAVGLYQMPSITFGEGDIVFLDYAITDNSYLEGKVKSADDVKMNIVSILFHLREKGALPVLLVYPEVTSFDHQTSTEKLHLQICRDVGLPFVNIAALFRAAAARGASIPSLMMDAAHQSPAVTPIVGEALVEAVALARKLGDTLCLSNLPIWNTKTLAAAPLVAPDQRTARSSSLRSSEMAVVMLGQTLKFDVPDDEQVLGVMINTGVSGAKTGFTGSQGTHVYDLRFDWDNQNQRSFMSRFLSFRNGLCGGPEGFTIEVLPADAQATEITAVRSDLLELYGEIHIEGILTGTAGVAPVQEASIKPADHDLLEGKYDKFVAEILERV